MKFNVIQYLETLLCSFTIVVLFLSEKRTSGSIVWTPVLPAQPAQVDLWTVSQSGCSCNDGSGSGDCACCVPRAACPCGEISPHRCAQCGLQQHCNKMCNVTIDGGLLSVTSGTMEGSLVPPSDLVSPINCWYSLRAPPGHRIEIQMHRLVHIGTSINGTNCADGYIEISDQDKRTPDSDSSSQQNGDWSGPQWRKTETALKWRGWTSHKGHTSIMICGQDKRLHPPTVLFSDSGIATIHYRVTAKYGSPRFIAYYNFPPMTDPMTGDKQWGGSRIEYTDCDWHYQDSHCTVSRQCHLTSPGHPGIYPTNAQCKYLLTMSDKNTEGTITFITLDLPEEQCNDFLTIYAGTSLSSPKIVSLCGANYTQSVTFNGPNALLLFRSGLSPSHRYNGFHATIFFKQVDGNREEKMPENLPSNPPDKTIMSHPSGLQVGAPEDCLRVFWSNKSRSGHFDSSTFNILESSFPSLSSLSVELDLTIDYECRLRFIGQSHEVVQISFFKYMLGGKDCSSNASIYDGLSTIKSTNLIQRICGPIVREPKDSSGRFVQPEFLISSSNVLEVTLNLGRNSDPKRQFLAGAYQFHSLQLEGTKKPDSVCDVMFYGADSPSSGIIHQPTSSLLWNVEGSLECSTFFVPGNNQSLEITIESIRSSDHPHLKCRTECSNGGCECLSLDKSPVLSHDRMLIIDSKRDHQIACLCGDVKNVIPLTLISMTGIDIRYIVNNYRWSSPGFNYSLTYHFKPPTICGREAYSTPAGLIVPPSDSNISPSALVVANCEWLIQNQVETQLTIVVQPPSRGSCLEWELKVLFRERGEGGEDIPSGSVCGGEGKKNFYLIQSHSAAVLKLKHGGRSVRDWLITWHTKRRGEVSLNEMSLTPKPEQSRTQHTRTGRTFVVRTSIASNFTSSWKNLSMCLFLCLVLSKKSNLAFFAVFSMFYKNVPNAISYQNIS